MAPADLVRGLDPLVGLRRRHADVHDRDVGLVLVDRGEQLLRVGRLGDDLDALAAHERRDALAQQPAVVGDHDPHGSSAVTTVPAPGGLRMRSVPSSAATRSASPWSPVPAVSSAPPTPSSAISMTAVPFRRETRTDALRRVRVLGDVGQRLARHEVRRELDRLGQALRALEGDGGRDARARRQGSSAASRPWLSTAGWMPRASSRSSSSDWDSSSPADLDRLGQLRVGAGAVLDHAQLEGHGHEPLLRAVVEVALEPPPLRVACGDEALARGAELGEPILALRLEPRVVERDRGRGRDGVHQLRIVVERPVVDEHRELAAVALDGRGDAVATRRGQLDRLSAAVDVGALARHPVRQHQAGIAEHLREPLLQPHAAQRAELTEEVGEPAAREPGAQQAPEQRGRDREQGRVQEPDERHHG